MFEELSSLSNTDQTDGAATTPDPIIEPPYFKEFLFYPSVVIKIAYEAKRFDMEKVLQCAYYDSLAINSIRESYQVFWWD